MIDVRNSPQSDGRQCPLCNGSNFRELQRWPVGDACNPTSIALAFWQCRCSLAMLHPIPRADQFLTPQAAPPARGRLAQALRRIPNFLLGTPAVRLVRQASRLVSHGHLLDIGCGNGELLDIASRRFECVGMETWQDAREAIRRGHRVMPRGVGWDHLQPRTFDVATLCGSLQRARDPVGTLFQANRLLRSGGLVAVRTPNLFGLSHRRQGGRWSGFSVGRHGFLFTAETLRLTMAAAGFAPLRAPRRDRPWDDELIVWGRKVREWEESLCPRPAGPENSRQAA